ncbi:MAG TPA: hypothetical protein VFG30_39360, partial [Polyangiales bacterium]|nr:hypothetical protein [Polyangiales bacterium]
MPAARSSLQECDAWTKDARVPPPRDLTINSRTAPRPACMTRIAPPQVQVLTLPTPFADGRSDRSTLRG